MKTCKNGLGYNISNSFCFAPFRLLTRLPIMHLFQCPISHRFTGLASVCSFPPVIIYPSVTQKDFIIFKLSISLPRLEMVNELKKKISGVHSATETKTQIR